VKPKLTHLWRQFARDVAALSTCSRTQVGCLLLSLDGERLLALGYNGGVRGGANVPPEGDVPGTGFWLHAEENALVKSRPFEPFIAFCTHTPCVRCAKLLLNAGVTMVYAAEAYRDPAGWLLLLEHEKGALHGPA
jgi:dCMP deaminase